MKTLWKYDKNRTRVIGFNSRGCLCHVADMWGNTFREVDEHGHLIAAAPIMYQYIKKQAAQGDAEAINIIHELTLD